MGKVAEPHSPMSGRLRALAVSSAQRLPALPEVPTVAESGYAGFEADPWYGLVVGQAVATAWPDGHTLLLMSNANAVSVSLFNKKLPFDTQKDFAPISTLGSFDRGLCVPANSCFASLRDLLAFARANPARLNVGTIAVRSTQHLAAKRSRPWPASRRCWLGRSGAGGT